MEFLSPKKMSPKKNRSRGMVCGTRAEDGAYWSSVASSHAKRARQEFVPARRNTAER